MACLTSFGAYSSTSKPAWAAISMIAPVARATCSALTWLRLHATRSIATAVGWCSSIADACAVGQGAQTRGSRRDRFGVWTVPLHTRGDLPVVLGEDGEAQPGHTGVHTEHARIEHLFAGV